jgi:hypothetical protein
MNSATTRFIPTMLLAFSALLFSQINRLEAATLTQPTGLPEGSQYRIVFVTTTTRNATSTNINDYNNFVNAAANANGSQLQSLMQTWKAIASTSSISGFNNIGGASSLPIYRMDGVLIANNTTDLWDTTIANLINVTELGTNTPSQFVWTGTLSNGGIDGFPLGHTGDAQNRVTRGWTTTLSPHVWTQGNLTNKSTSYPLYGISGPITVVPEPGTFVVAGLGMIGLLVAARRRRQVL